METKQPDSETAKMAEILRKMPDPNKNDLTDLWNGSLVSIFAAATSVTSVGIFLLDTGELIGKSSNFNTRTGEFDDIVNNFDDLEVLYRDGVTINGETYKVRLADGRFGIFAKSGKRGCSVAKTFTLLIVAVHDEKGNGPICNELVMGLGDYFFKKGL